MGSIQEASDLIWIFFFYIEAEEKNHRKISNSRKFCTLSEKSSGACPRIKKPRCWRVIQFPPPKIQIFGIT